MIRSARRLAPWLALALLLFGGWQVGHGVFLHAKAWLAQELLQRAWHTTLAEGGRVKPWPWADTWPVARLEVPRLGIDRIVLAGASGRNLAFAPGHVDGTAAPGAVGNSVIGGHRDTHFRFLRELGPGDELVLTAGDGEPKRYRVVESAVVEDGAAGIRLDAAAPALTLVTCYPFDSVVPGGPLRYVVIAEGLEPGGGRAHLRAR